MNSDKIVSIIVIGFVIGAVSIALAGAEYFEELTNADAKNAASFLIAGYNIGNHDRYLGDPGALQRYFIEGMENHYDIGVFGNSRAHGVYNTNFPDLTLVNNAVPGANFAQIQGLADIYLAHDNIPNVIIIVTDPWTVLYRKSEENGGENENYLHRFAVYFKSVENIPKIFDENNLKVLLGMKTPYYATNEKQSDRTILRIDGFAYPNLLYTQDEKYVDRIALEGDLLGISKITPEYTLAFENYIETLQGRGITLIFILAPFHHLRYLKYQDAKKENPEMTSLDDVETYIRNFANRHGIVVIGSYNPDIYNLTSNYFSDGLHPKPQAIAKIVVAQSHELYDLLYTDIYPTYEEYAIALAESQSELFT